MFQDLIKKSVLKNRFFNLDKRLKVYYCMCRRWPMSTMTLLDKIGVHEVWSIGSGLGEFKIAEVHELADGVIAACDTQGEYSLYFDHIKCVVCAVSMYDDASCHIHLPEGTGFIVDLQAHSWACIAETARNSLATKDGKEIAWHQTPIRLVYRD